MNRAPAEHPPVRDAVGRVPDGMVCETPDDIVRETPDGMVRETPDNMVRETPDNIVRETPDSIVRETPDDMVRGTPDNIVRETPDGMRRAYIGIGSNLHSPEQQLQRAARALDALPHSRLLCISPQYRNPALTASQPEYLNAVAALDSTLSPQTLLCALQDIERRQGRVRNTGHWAPRTLDLDLLLYGELCIDTPELQLPHPRMLQRDFVLYPLFDLAPALVFPGGIRLEQVLQKLPRRRNCLRLPFPGQDGTPRCARP